MRTRSRSFSDVATMWGTNTTRVSCSHPKMSRFLTFTDLFWLKIQEFSDLKLSGPREKAMLSKTMKCCKIIYKQWEEIHSSNQTVLCRSYRNCNIPMECSKATRYQYDPLFFWSQSSLSTFTASNLNQSIKQPSILCLLYIV